MTKAQKTQRVRRDAELSRRCGPAAYSPNNTFICGHTVLRNKPLSLIDCANLTAQII